MQFSTRVLLLLTLAAAIDASSMKIGGIYFIAPLGCLTCGFLCGLHELWRYWKSQVRPQFFHSANAPGGCILVAASISLLLLYAPFMELVAHYRDSGVREQSALNLIEKNAEIILSEGRGLIARTQTNERIAGDSPLMPPSIRALHPKYIDNHGSSLLVYMKPGIDSVTLRIFAQGQPGTGGRRLIPGLWVHDRYHSQLISDSAWEAGIRK